MVPGQFSGRAITSCHRRVEGRRSRPPSRIQRLPPHPTGAHKGRPYIQPSEPTRAGYRHHIM